MPLWELVLPGFDFAMMRSLPQSLMPFAFALVCLMVAGCSRDHSVEPAAVSRAEEPAAEASLAYPELKAKLLACVEPRRLPADSEMLPASAIEEITRLPDTRESLAPMRDLFAAPPLTRVPASELKPSDTAVAPPAPEASRYTATPLPSDYSRRYAEPYAPDGRLQLPFEITAKELPKTPEVVPPAPQVVETPAPRIVESVPAAPVARPSAEPRTLSQPDSQPPSANLLVVTERADQIVRKAFSLAERGAVYSARAEFLRALRLIAQAVDAQNGNTLASQSLTDGMRALKEADDFAPKGKGSEIEAETPVADLVASHRTSVLKNAAGSTTPLTAIQSYYTYAQEQLGRAGGRLPVASLALYGLAKVQMALSPSADGQQLAGPKAMSLYQAALLVDPRNHLAANELGVLLAHYGQLPEARGVLLHGLATFPTADSWHNLAVVHERLGETDLARRARHEQQLALNSQGSRRGDVRMRWVSPEEFAQTTPASDQPPPPGPEPRKPTDRKRTASGAAPLPARK